MSGVIPVRVSLLLSVAMCVSSCGEPPSAATEAPDPPVRTAESSTSNAESSATDNAASGGVESASVREEDWPVFLGPRQNGTSLETGLLPTWPAAGLRQVWQKEIGTGYTAPSVVGERLVLHHRIADNEIVECLQPETGETLWTYRYPSHFVDPYGYNNGPRCAPLLTDSLCYTFGAEGKLTCLALDGGAEEWTRDIKADFNVPDGFFGVGSTPILEGGKLIVAAGGQPNSGIVALDPATGTTVWENIGKSTWDGAETGLSFRPRYEWQGDEMVVSYSSPIAATIDGKRHVLCLMRQGLVSVDPETGAENFHYWFCSTAYESVNAARPVIVDDTILLSAAYKVGSALLRVAEDGKSVLEVWRNPTNLMTHWSTAIYHDGYYYGFSGRHKEEATMRCIDAKTGEIAWQTTGSDRDDRDFRLVNDGSGHDDMLYDVVSKKTVPNPFYGRASAIMVEGKLIVLTENGTLALVKVNPQRWEEICRFKVPAMHYPSWPAPVLSHGRLYLRCEDALVCYDLRGGE